MTGRPHEGDTLAGPWGVLGIFWFDRMLDAAAGLFESVFQSFRWHR